MSSLTNEQVAELLLGIARSQLAIADAIESSKAGFKATHLRGNVESAARIKMNRPLALSDLPSRLLLQMLGRNAPTQEAVARDLQALLNAGAPAAPGGDTLDTAK
ncbi:MAG: hypothetical protein ABL891_03230 [Burkholderiales bacterium]